MMSLIIISYINSLSYFINQYSLSSYSSGDKYLRISSNAFPNPEISIESRLV